MARKRARKKELKRHHELRDRAEDLYLRGEDGAFLDLVVQVADLGAVGLAEAYREVVDRSLRRNLAKGDVEALAKLLARPRAGADKLPSAVLAAAVVDLDAGRLDRARVLLEPLASATGDGSPAVRGLAAALLPLCATEPGATGPGASKAGETKTGPLADYHKLCRTLDRYAAGDVQKLPGNLHLADPRAKEALELVRALETVGRAPRPAPKSLARLRAAARALLEGPRPDEDTEVLALGAIRFARWLADAAELESDLDQRDAGLWEVGEVLRRFREDRDRLAELFDERMPAALHGLRHALETRCRAILGRLVELSGPGALARVRAAVGGAFDSILETVPASGGEPRERIEKWAEVTSLFDRQAFHELARFSARESAEADDPCRLAMLWAVELGCLWREAEEAEDVFDEDDEQFRVQSWLRLLGRLKAISGELGRRLPVPEQRVQVARVLRRRLLEAAGSVELTGHFLAIAENLLGQLEGDAALLLIALAAATETGDRTAARRFAERVAARGPASTAELDELLPFVSPPAGGEPEDMMAFLERARPLFGEAWPLARSAAATIVEMRGVLVLGTLLEADEFPDPDVAEWGRSRLRTELEVFRPLFSEERGFQVVELLADAAFEDERTVRSSVRDFLRRCGDLEAALAALRSLDSLSDLPSAFPAFVPSRALAVEAVLSRLDHRWPLWRQSIETILPALERKQLLLGHNRLAKVLSDGALDAADRREIEDVQSLFEELLDMFRRRPRRKTTRSRRGAGKKRRRGARKPAPPPADGRQLELFGPSGEALP